MAVVSDNCVSVSIRLSKSYFTSPLTLILSDEGATEGLKSLLCLSLPKDLRLSLRCVGKNVVARRLAAGKRSEEHTSELQSLMRISYAVFCLKKKHIKL